MQVSVTVLGQTKRTAVQHSTAAPYFDQWLIFEVGCARIPGAPHLGRLLVMRQCGDASWLEIATCFLPRGAPPPSPAVFRAGYNRVADGA